jgi:hypothetical protein
MSAFSRLFSFYCARMVGINGNSQSERERVAKVLRQHITSSEEDIQKTLDFCLHLAEAIINIRNRMTLTQKNGQHQ